MRIDNYRASISHQKPEALILDLGGCPVSSMEGQSQNRLLDLLGFDKPAPELLRFGKIARLEERLLQYLDIDTRSVGEILRPQDSQYEVLSDDLYVDEWGIKRRFTGLYWDIVEYPLKDKTMEDLDTYHFPNGDSIDEEQIKQIAEDARRLYEAEEYVICAEHPVYGVFELGCWLCGFEDFLIRMLLEPEFVHKLFSKILDYQKKVIDIYYNSLGSHIHYTSCGDDFATQSNLFMSPANFREFIKPYLAERIAHTKKYTQAQFLHHSCGNVYAIIPDLIEAGVEILNPIQPVSPEMSPRNLKDTFGDKIVLHGGIDTQHLLPNGTRQSIEEGVHEAIEVLNEGGGYIFAAAHNIQEDVPPENVIYMFQAARKFGGR
jgi:uroporphyrinogen decarboxylase